MKATQRLHAMQAMQAVQPNEQIVSQVLDVRNVGYELGLARNADVADVPSKNQSFFQREIQGRELPFVELVRDGHPE